MLCAWLSAWRAFLDACRGCHCPWRCTSGMRYRPCFSRTPMNSGLFLHVMRYLLRCELWPHLWWKLISCRHQLFSLRSWGTWGILWMCLLVVLLVITMGWVNWSHCALWFSLSWQPWSVWLMEVIWVSVPLLCPFHWCNVRQLRSPTLSWHHCYPLLSILCVAGWIVHVLFCWCFSMFDWRQTQCDRPWLVLVAVIRL